MRSESKVAGSTALFAAAAAAATSSSAMAADILNTKVRPALAPAPIAAWQGFYVGGSLGGSWLNSTQDDTGAVATLSGGYYSSPGGTSSQNASALGFLGGLQAGYNFQSGRSVYGFEADFSWIGGGSASSTSNQPRNVGYYSYGTQSGTKSSKVKALATFRARFGIDMDGTMPYLTAGFALGQVRNSYGLTLDITGPIPVGGPSSITQTTSKTSWEPGLVLGGGIEHRFANSPWSIKGEALWVGFRDSQLNVAYGGYSTPVKFKNELVVGKIGLNYRF